MSINRLLDFNTFLSKKTDLHFHTGLQTTDLKPYWSSCYIIKRLRTSLQGASTKLLYREVPSWLYFVISPALYCTFNLINKYIYFNKHLCYLENFIYCYVVWSILYMYMLRKNISSGKCIRKSFYTWILYFWLTLYCVKHLFCDSLTKKFMFSYGSLGLIKINWFIA